MSTESAYDALNENNDARWAYGTGFSDPLSGVDQVIPAGVDGDDLALYCQMLGDDALIMSHRLQQWCTCAPELEDEVALANIGLDLLGQARLLLTRAGHANGSDRSEDDFAFGRRADEFRNVALVEQPNGDFAQSVARLLIFSTWRLALLQALATTRDTVLSAIAVKAIAEVTYHRDYAAQWAVRLGDGTAYSHQRFLAGLDAIAPWLGELFQTHPVEKRLAAQGVAVDPARVRDECGQVLAEVLTAATVPVPPVIGDSATAEFAGRDGRHSAHFAELVDELQSVARQLPAARW